MQLTIRTAVALLALTLLASTGHAADPADSPAGEAKAIQGDEGKSSSGAVKPGPSTEASPAGETKAIEGDEGKSSSGAMKPGPSTEASPEGEAKAIEGNE
jgi:hypothetical protein